jgi:hypothetical protein
MYIMPAVLVFLFLVVVIFFTFFIDSFFGGLDFSTDKQASDGIIEFIKSKYLGKENFYDLGSGYGGLASKIAKAFPGNESQWDRQ